MKKGHNYNEYDNMSNTRDSSFFEFPISNKKDTKNHESPQPKLN